MKLAKLLSLFLYSTLTAVIYFPVYGQQTALDSILDYRKLVTDARNTDDLIAGYVFFRNHKEKSTLNNDTISILFDLQMIVIAESELGAYYDAKASIAEALELIDLNSHPDSFLEDKLRLYNELGIVYRALNNYDKALVVYDNTLSISHPNMDSVSMMTNKANVYMNQGKWHLAKDLYQKVYDLRLLHGDKRRIARALNNLGSVQSKLNDSEGIENMLSALDIRLEEKDQSGIFSSYNHLTNYYKNNDDLAKANLYATLGYQYARSYSPAYKLEALDNLLELSNDSIVIEYRNLRDSINKAKLLNDNKYAITRYNVEEEQRKTMESEIKREKQKRMTLLYQFIGGFILIASGLLYLMLRSRFKKQKLKEVYETETRIARKVHDEVANDVYHVMSKLQSKNSNNTELLDDLEIIYNKTRNISKESGVINVGDNFDVILNDLLINYQNDDINIIAKDMSKINWNAISETKKTVLYRVLQELLTNIRKHSQASLVAITFSHIGNKLQVECKDNGVGCKLKKSNGLLNVENRIRIINGTISFESDIENGFKAIITL